MHHHVLYRQSRFPVLQNRLFESRHAALSCVTGDILLVQDADTGLIRNDRFDASLLAYDATYHNEQECSEVFRQHLTTVADVVARTLGADGLVEVGCGKGYFLELLSSLGFTIAGLDPAYEGSNPRVSKSILLPDASLRARGIILRHVLEHIPDPVGFLALVRSANDANGRIYIEVPCFDWIREHRTWFDIFYEHVNYFRLDDLHRMFDEVVESGRLFGGQYLYCVADLKHLRDTPRTPWRPAVLPEHFLPSRSAPSRGIQPKAARQEAVWGCASKGVIFSLLRDRLGSPLDVAIDINPKKQGLYLPCSGLKVISPQEAFASLPLGSTIHVMNPMYAAEIRSLAGTQYAYVMHPETTDVAT